ncbi:hypothetical protein [Roseibium algae]|uniref:Uncharacterized protein n=1 Tax=Roseibium algae TaxID=3123038 RepID=A0ABU8TJZ6_9HYPH
MHDISPETALLLTELASLRHTIAPLVIWTALLFPAFTLAALALCTLAKASAARDADRQFGDFPESSDLTEHTQSPKTAERILPASLQRATLAVAFGIAAGHGLFLVCPEV